MRAHCGTCLVDPLVTTHDAGLDRLAAVDSSTTPVTFRLMVFNIEDGGEGVDLGKVVEAIRRSEPDAVALQEAMGNTARIAEALGWDHVSTRTQVIARHPIADPPGGDTYQFIELRPGRVVALASVHLPAEPYGPEAAASGAEPTAIVALERQVRLPRMLRTLGPLPALVAAGTPVFLAGDLNAPSHLDWTVAAAGSRSHRASAIDWPVSRALEDAGFRDTWREIHPDPVAAPGLTWWADRPPTGGWEPGPESPHDRIDFILAAGPSVTVDAVIVGETGRPDVAIAVDPWPSDHRAVVSTFLVSAATMTLDPTAAVPNLRSALRAPRAPVALTTTKPVYVVGESIDVRWHGGPGYRWDWIAVFPTGTEDLRDRHLIWRHTDARLDGIVHLDADAAVVDQSPAGGRWPLPPGDYEAHYLLDDSSRTLGRASFRVVTPRPD
jgi:endonuclease/exonuclease/phosphatase family metal-dependent hydrolase